MKDINRIHTPYRGDSPYIFISYSHKDSDIVFDIIGQLQMKQYRVWYDEGIDPGTEWDENIAEHVEQCGYFIALLSRAYLESSNCKDELNYARELEKPRLLVYLEDVQLPGGMRMRLSRLQAIHKYKYSSAEQFINKLSETNGLEICRGCYSDTGSVELEESIFYKSSGMPQAKDIANSSAPTSALMERSESLDELSYTDEEDYLDDLKSYIRNLDWTSFRDN